MNPFQPMGREHSQLFLVRLWAEEAPEESASQVNEARPGQSEWCGKVQDVVSGQAYYFRGWPTMIDLLLEMTEAEGQRGADAGADTDADSTRDVLR